MITTRTGPAHTRLLGVGGYRPERIVTNAEICEWIDSSDEWIRERSGIIERRFAAENESVVDMATSAGKAALAASGIPVERIGMVLVATVTHPMQTPSAACDVAFRLGASRASAMDISAACAGFCYGVGIADSLIRAGTSEYVLIIGVEKLTDWVNRDDRSAGFLFADGAGAAVIGPSETPGIGPTIWGSDGSHYETITMTQTLVDYRDRGGAFPTLSMQGQTVFRWAVGEMAKVAAEAIEAAGITPDQLDAFIPHQANLRIVDALVRQLGLPKHIPVARDITHMGNTSAASIPLAMERMLEQGEIPHGGTALLIGFGAGLAYAAQVVTLP